MEVGNRTHEDEEVQRMRSGRVFVLSCPSSYP